MYINKEKRPPFSAELREKLSLANRGKKFTEEHKNKIAESLRGKPKSEQHRKNLSIAHKGKKLPPFSEEHKKKMGRFGEDHWHWKGGGGGSGFEERQRMKLATRPRPENCEICGTHQSNMKLRLALDHDHATGKFRGWLCGNCNTALGLVGDSRERLKNMIIYLTQNTIA